MKFVNCLNKLHTTVPFEGSEEDRMLCSEEDRMLQTDELKLNSNHENYPHDAMHVYAQLCTVMHGMNTDSNCFLEENSQIYQQTLKI